MFSSQLKKWWLVLNCQLLISNEINWSLKNKINIFRLERILLGDEEFSWMVQFWSSLLIFTWEIFSQIVSMLRLKDEWLNIVNDSLMCETHTKTSKTLRSTTSVRNYFNWFLLLHFKTKINKNTFLCVTQACTFFCSNKNGKFILTFIIS